MIIRILGEGQYAVAEAHHDELDRLDTTLETAVEARDEAAFAAAMSALLQFVHHCGTPLGNETLTPSELVLPDRDMTLAQVRNLLSVEGLVSG